MTRRQAISLQCCLLTALCARPWPGAAADRSPLDLRRVELLARMDNTYIAGAEDPGLPTPNLALSGDHAESSGNYLNKSLAIFALIDAGEASVDRLDEANRYLRYMQHKWPITSPNDIIGPNASIVNHSRRSTFVRAYALYAHYLEDDVREVFERTLSYCCAPPFQRSSENIRMTRNSMQFLAHELTGKTDLDSYRACRDWIIPTMQSYLRDGPHEWGRWYLVWTMGATLNLAEFSRDPEVRRLATMVVDYYLALLSGFNINGNVGTGSVRSWGWSFSAVTSPTLIAHNLFPEHHDIAVGVWFLPNWTITNYRPLAAVSLMHGNREPLEATMTTGTARKWRHHVYRGRHFLIASHQAPKSGTFRLPSGGTHDIFGVHIQSARSPRNTILPYGCVPMDGPSKQRSLMNRYFTYRNVGFAQTGGTMIAVWAGGHQFPGVHLRLFHHFDFRREIRDGWAFLTDGTIYVAWRPARGVPEPDPDTDERTTGEDWGGRWLKSTYEPDEKGEACVLEVDDADMFGSYRRFKRDVRRRNPDPVDDEGWFRYRTRDGSLIEFGDEYAKVDGVEFDPETYARASMPGLRDFTITAGGAEITFDPERIAVSGDLTRVPATIAFGRPPAIQGA